MATIREVDPHDDADLRAWYEAMHDSATDGRAAPLVSSYAELSASLRNPGEEKIRTPYAALVGTAVVGTLMLELPLKENRHVAEVNVAVAPRHRNRGHGSRLLEYARERAGQTGRTTYLAEVDVHPGTPLETWPGSRFALRNRFTSEHQEDHLVLDLPAAFEGIDAVEARSAREHSGFTFVSWTGGCPEEHADALTAMHNAMERDMPSGTIDDRPRVWDPDRLRVADQRLAEQGLAAITTAARDAGGVFAGYSQLFVLRHTPGEVLQDDTLVMSEYRGHRLGAALKARNLRTLSRAFPDSRRVHTWTAGVNGPMQAINRAFGFAAVEQTHWFQRVDRSGPS